MTDDSMRSRWDRLESLWERAVALAPAERESFVRGLGVEDAALRDELEALLAASRHTERFFTRFAEVIAAGADEALLASRLQELQAGLAGRYALEREVGHGGMATVYLARDLRHNREVALKVLEPELTAALGVDRFLREIEIVAGLRHAHVLPLYDSGEAGSFLYYVMPYEPGRSLRERLDRDGPLPLNDAVRILRDIVDALAHAHEHGIVHCDIKPENILLSARHATVADFGVARALTAASRSSGGTTAPDTLGTPRYMAPEQATGSDAVDHRADIYAVGVVAWEMLAGRPPFTGDTAQAVLSAHMTQQPEPLAAQRPDVPAGLEGLVMKCLEKRPADRWQRADELLAHLEALQPAAHDAQAGVPIPTSASRRGRTVRWLAIGAIVATIGALPWTLRLVMRARADGARAAPEAGAPPDTDTGASRTPGRTSTDPAALELYRLAGDNRVFRSDSAAREALGRFQQAVRLDSGFAVAWAGLAQMYIRVAPGENPAMPLRERLRLAEQFARRALDLDASLAQAHRSFGNIYLREFRFDEAERELKLAVRLDPREALGSEALVRLYIFTGRLQDALDVGRAAVNPASPGSYAEFARALLVNGRCDLAREQLARVANVRPPVGRARLVAAQCDALEGRWQDAIQQMAEPQAVDGLRMLGYLYARSGQRDSALAVLEQLRRDWQRSGDGAFGLAEVYTGLRDLDQAFFWLDRSVDDLSLRWDVMEPMFASLHADPRFDELKQRLGLQNR